MEATIMNDNTRLYSDAIIQLAHSMNDVKHLSIPLVLLNLDAPYQRVRTQNISKMAANWDAHKCKDILVSYRDGQFYVIDGANRCAAAKIAGVHTINCILYEGLTEKDEAKLFAQQDDLKQKVSTVDKFKALLVAENHVAIAIAKLCNEYSVKIRKYNTSDVAVLTGFSALMHLYEHHGESGLRWVFDVIKQSGWHSVRGAYGSTIISSLEYMYETYFGYSKDEAKQRLAEKLSISSPVMLAAKAQMLYADRGVKRAIMAYLSNYIFMESLS